jgi:hypothetical protein
MAEEGRQSRGEQQDDDEDVLELFEQDRPGRDAPRGLQLVRPQLLQAARGLVGRQARRR